MILSLLHARDKDLQGPGLNPRQSHSPPYECPNEVDEPLSFIMWGLECSREGEGKEEMKKSNKKLSERIYTSRFRWNWWQD